jgi:signal transduction histidine kinase
MNIEELKSELDQLNDEKYNLLKLVNHDIRSPFNRIFALLHLFEMESREISIQQKEYLDAMYLSILSGLEMIDNLRDMREIDAGHIEIDETEFDLVNTIKKAIRSFSKQIEIKKMNLVTELSIEKAQLVSDEYYVQRVIENVLSNAVKFSKREKDIIVRLKNNKNEILVEIQDSGDGIKQEEEHLLFKKFKILSSVASGGEGSLGLGLHNTVYFIKRLKGSITLNRNVEIGSSFIIKLPI